MSKNFHELEEKSVKCIFHFLRRHIRAFPVFGPVLYLCLKQLLVSLEVAGNRTKIANCNK